MGGMIAATVLGVFFAPLVFVAVRHLTTREAKQPQSIQATSAE
jgi:hypothetical protein